MRPIYYICLSLWSGFFGYEVGEQDWTAVGWIGAAIMLLFVTLAIRDYKDDV